MARSVSAVDSAARSADSTMRIRSAVSLILRIDGGMALAISTPAPSPSFSAAKAASLAPRPPRQNAAHKNSLRTAFAFVIIGHSFRMPERPADGWRVSSEIPTNPA